MLRRPLLDRVRRPGDLALALALSAVGVLELWLLDVGPKPIAVPATLLAGLALYWRRVAPLAVATAVFGATGGESLVGVSLAKPDSPMLMAFVSLYAVGAYLELRHALLGLGIAIAGIWAGTNGTTTNGHSNFTFTLVVVSAAWLIGRGMRGRVRQTVQLDRADAAARAGPRAGAAGGGRRGAAADRPRPARRDRALRQRHGRPGRGRRGRLRA